MSTNLLSLLSFVLISTFTPGPSNITSASTGVLHGYKKTLNYQAGLAVAVFLVMLLSGWLSTTLLSIFPTLEPALRYIGAGYILYLAFRILKARYFFAEEDAKPPGFLHGIMLQILNPKVYVYAFTLFAVFLAPITIHLTQLVLAAVLLAATSFCATSVWALFGTVIQTRLHNPRLEAIVNIVFSLFLVYTAIALVGIV